MLKRQKFQNRGHWRARPIRAAEARGRSGAGARLGCGALEKTRRCRKGCKGGRRLYGSACNSSPGARCKIQALSALLPALRAKDAPAAQTCPAGRGSIPGQGPKSTPGLRAFHRRPAAQMKTRRSQAARKARRPPPAAAARRLLERAAEGEAAKARPAAPPGTGRLRFQADAQNRHRCRCSPAAPSGTGTQRLTRPAGWGGGP